MNSQNFEHLRPHWPELADLGAHAEQYAFEDPQSALIKLRCYAEKLVGIVYQQWRLPSYPNEKFIDRLENNTFAAVVDQAIIDKLHAIRKEANKAAHEGRFSEGSSLWLLKEAHLGQMLHKEDYIEGGIPLINPTHIVKGRIVPKSKLSISVEKHKDLPEYHLKTEDIIMGRRGEMGRCAVVEAKENGWMCGTGSLYIRPNKTGVFSEYLNKLLSSKAIKQHLESESQGATMANLNKTIVGEIQIPVPSDEVLNKFAEVTKKHQVTKHGFINFRDVALFDYLSQKAFAGDL